MRHRMSGLCGGRVRFLVVVVSIVVVVVASGCAGNAGSSCTLDSDCGRGQTCDATHACVGGGEGEGEGEGDVMGEGEGEVQGCATQQAVFGLPDGDGSI